ncbi:MAG TPA: DUF4124 domain-containing protein [Aeromonadales bacterium]|nr:DUF4124 domain-containing protein [Aeromonadales bacterium]
MNLINGELTDRVIFKRQRLSWHLFSGLLLVLGVLFFSLKVYADPIEELQEYTDDRSDEEIELAKQNKGKKKAQQRKKNYIYQWQDENGNTVISDKPHPGAVAIPVPRAQNISTSPTHVRQNFTLDTEDGTKTDDNSSPPDLTIISPANDSWLDNNLGNVTIQVAVTPSLLPGQVLQILLDGEVKNSANSSSITLKNLSRGEHSVVAQVIMKSSKKILRSKQITFYVRRPIVKRH